VEDQNSRRMALATRSNQAIDVNRFQQIRINIGQISYVQELIHGIAHSSVSGQVTTSPSSFVKSFTGRSSSDNTFSDGRHRATPLSVTTIGRLMRIGCAIMASTNCSSLDIA